MTIKQVLITGATGKTGSIVYQKLDRDSSFQVKGLAQSPEKAKDLFDSNRKTYISATLPTRKVSKLPLATVTS